MEDDLERYLKLIPTIIKNFLDRVEGFQLNDKADLPENLRILGLETELVEISRLLLGLKGKNERIPSFDELTRVVEGIAYYFYSAKSEIIDQSDVWNARCPSKRKISGSSPR